jgi:hypothetical protein
MTLRMRYGLTAEQVDAMIAEQDGLCAICREKPAGHVDHDHVTGEVRGILCSGCNAGLGSFGDSLDRVYGALSYLLARDLIFVA